MDYELAALQQRISDLVRDAQQAPPQTPPLNDSFDPLAEAERRLVLKAKEGGRGLKSFMED